MTCILCGNEASEGIKRFKHHLAGGYGDIILCPKVTTEIRKEMEAYLQKKRRRPLFLDGIEEEDEVVEVAAADVQAGVDGAATPKPAAKNQVLGQPLREGMLPINSRLQDLAMAIQHQRHQRQQSLLLLCLEEHLNR